MMTSRLVERAPAVAARSFCAGASSLRHYHHRHHHSIRPLIAPASLIILPPSPRYYCSSKSSPVMTAKRSLSSTSNNSNSPDQQQSSRSSSNKQPKMGEDQAAENGGSGEKAHQYQAGDTTHREEDQWKFKAPYKIHDDGSGFETKWKGRCHCGKVRYELSRDRPLASKYCHCTTCQRLHGSPFQWAAIFHKEDINFTSGIHDLGWYDPTAKSTTHHLPCKVHCAYCRTPIMDEGRNMILLFPTLIEGINTEKGKEAFAPQSHMFYPQRVVDFKGDGVRKFKGLQDESPLVDDDGVELPGQEDKKKKEEEKKK